MKRQMGTTEADNINLYRLKTPNTLKTSPGGGGSLRLLLTALCYHDGIKCLCPRLDNLNTYFFTHRYGAATRRKKPCGLAEGFAVTFLQLWSEF